MDIAAIGSAVTSLRVAGEIAKGLISLNTMAEVQAKANIALLLVTLLGRARKVTSSGSATRKKVTSSRAAPGNNLDTRHVGYHGRAIASVLTSNLHAGRYLCAKHRC